MFCAESDRERRAVGREDLHAEVQRFGYLRGRVSSPATEIEAGGLYLRHQARIGGIDVYTDLMNAVGNCRLDNGSWSQLLQDRWTDQPEPGTCRRLPEFIHGC